MIIRATGQEDVVNDYVYAEPSFTDVPKDHWAFAYVEAGKDLGIINGYPDGTFKPDKPVKFEELCKMLVAAKGESPAAGKWPLNYVRKALDLGFFNGIEDEVGIGDVVIRGQAAVAFANAFFQPEKTIVVKDVKAVANDTIEVYVDVYLNNEPATLEDGDVIPLDFEIKDASDPSKTIAVTLIDSQASDFGAGKLVLKTAAQTPNATYKVFYKGQDTGKTFVGMPLNLQVANVATDNLKTITVTFNDELDTSTVVKDNFAVAVGSTTKTINSVKLLSDNKTVVIALDGTFNQFDSATITVKKAVKSKYGKTLTADYSKTITVQDVKQPSVTKVTVLNPKQLKIEFSEPINRSTSGDSYEDLSFVKVNGVPVIGKVVENNLFEKYLIVESFNVLTSGEVAISGLTDFAGYSLVAYTAKVDIPQDTTAPKLQKAEIVYVDATITKVKLVFDEPIVYDNNTEIYINDTSNKATIYNKNNNELYVQVNRSLVGVQTLIVKYKNVKDLVGNSTGEVSTAISLTIDTTTPDVSGTPTPNSDNTIVVNFTKPVYGGKVYINGTEKSYTLSADYKQITITSGITEGGSYTLELKEFRDTSPLQLLMPNKTFTVTLNDISTPSVTWSAKKADTVAILFSEPMDTSVLSDKTKYVINSTSLNNIANSTVTISDNDRLVKIYAPGQTINSVTIIGPKDKAGNLVPTGVVTITSFEDYTSSDKVGVSSATFTGTNKVKVTFTIPVTSVSVNAFKVIKTSDNIPYYCTGVSLSSDRKSAEFTFYNLNVPVDVEPGTYVLATLSSTGLASIFGTGLDASVNVAISESIAPSLTATAAGIGSISLTVSEKVYAKVYNTQTGNWDVTVSGDTIKNIITVVDASTGSTIDRANYSVSVIATAENKIVQLIITGLNSGKTYKVTVENSNSVKLEDVHGNGITKLDAAQVTTY